MLPGLAGPDFFPPITYKKIKKNPRALLVQKHKH